MPDDPFTRERTEEIVIQVSKEYGPKPMMILSAMDCGMTGDHDLRTAARRAAARLVR